MIKTYMQKACYVVEKAILARRRRVQVLKLGAPGKERSVILALPCLAYLRVSCQICCVSSHRGSMIQLSRMIVWGTKRV